MNLVSAVPLDEGQRARLEGILPLDIVDSRSFMPLSSLLESQILES